MAESSEAAPRRVRDALVAVAATVGTLALFPAFMALVFTVSNAPPRTSGPGFTGDGDLAGLRFQPDTCASGKGEGFQGADLVQQKASIRLRLVRDPVAEEWVLTLHRPGAAVLLLRQRGCADLEAIVKPHHEGRREASRWGSLRLDCTAPDGKARLRGAIEFAGCR